VKVEKEREKILVQREDPERKSAGNESIENGSRENGSQQAQQSSEKKEQNVQETEITHPSEIHPERGRREKSSRQYAVRQQVQAGRQAGENLRTHRQVQQRQKRRTKRQCRQSIAVQTCRTQNEQRTGECSRTNPEIQYMRNVPGAAEKQAERFQRTRNPGAVQKRQ